jgi:TonB family protein
MKRSSVLLAALAVSVLLPPARPSIAAEERSYSDQERIEICQKKGNAPLGPSEAQPLEVGGNVSRPQILHQVKPEYPRPPASGTVVVKVVVDEDGCVRDPQVLQGVSKSHDEIAVEAIRQWVFRPATQEGKPVTVSYVLTIKTQTSRGIPPKDVLKGIQGWVRPADKKDEVYVFNVGWTGPGAALPKKIEGCDFVDSVYATIPETVGSSVGFFDPKGLLPTLRERAAHKSANTVVVVIPSGAWEAGRRTLRGNAFRCGNQPLPAELGDPIP